MQLNEALALIKQQELTILTLKGSVTDNQLRAAYYEREMRMINAGLPGGAKDILRKAFENSFDNAGLKEAINVEKRRWR